MIGKQFKETLVGIFIVAGIILFIILYAWLSGRIGLRNTYDVVVYFEDVTGLRIGDPVMVYGLERGKIKSLKIEQGVVKTIIALDRTIVLPADSKIAIRSVSYVGSDRYVKITPGSDEEPADVYFGQNETLDLEAMVTQFDSLLIMFKDLRPEELMKIVAKLSQDVDKTIKELSKVFKSPVERIGGVVEKIEILVEELDSLSVLLRGDGTFGRLLKSDELYEEVRETNMVLKDLIEDIKENPKKYINIKVF